MTEHTPGPWIHEDTSVYYLDWDGVSYEGRGKDYRQMLTNRFYCGLQGQEKRIPHDELVANARLMAAAPALLEALMSVRTLISEAAMTGFNWRDGDWADRLFASQRDSSAAIRLATSTRAEASQ